MLWTQKIKDFVLLVFSQLSEILLFSVNGHRAIQKSNCYHREGHEAACEYSDTYYMLIFGAVQLILSQAPDFHNIQSLSVIAAVMSFAYSFIGFGLGVAKVIGMAVNLLFFQYAVSLIYRRTKCLDA